MSIVLELLATPVVAILFVFVGLALQSAALELWWRLAWWRRGLLSGPRLGGWLGTLVPLALPLLLVAGAAFKWPALSAWTAQSWGVRAGLGLWVLWEMLTARGKARTYDSFRASFFEDNREALPGNLGVRDQTYLKPFRVAWEKEKEEERARVEQKASPSAPPGGMVIGYSPDGQPAAHLEFEVLSAQEGMELTGAPPYCAPGGSWTVLSCRTTSAPAAAFHLAERSGPPGGGEVPVAWGEARLWVSSLEDGRQLARAITTAFPARSGPPGEGLEPAPPVEFSTTVFSRAVQLRPDGSLAGKGSWTASKWFYQEATEFFVNWSVKERRGRFSEKDEEYRVDLHEAFRSLVR